MGKELEQLLEIFHTGNVEERFRALDDFFRVMYENETGDVFKLKHERKNVKPTECEPED